MTSNSETNVCLALLSGIPAAGKTTLAKLFCECIHSMPFDLRVRDKKGYLRVIDISYDELIPGDLAFSDSESQETNIATWKHYRDQIHVCVDKLLDSFVAGHTSLLDALKKLEESETADSSELQRNVTHNFCKILRHQLKGESLSTEPIATVLLLDDNFFYRSMRYEFYQLARKYSTGFCQVHISCPIHVAVSRNAQRSHPITMETYNNMLSKIEEPGTSRVSWENNYLIVDGDCHFDHLQLSQMWGLIYDALHDPVPPLEEEDVEAKEQARTASLASTLHQADIILRKCVSESIAKAKEDGRAVEVKTIAAKVNRGKTTLLERIRAGAVALPPLDCKSTSVQSGPSETFEERLRTLFQEFLQTG